jgi:hypothetical protein
VRGAGDVPEKERGHFKTAYKTHIEKVRRCMTLQGKGGKCKAGANAGMVCSKDPDCPGSVCVGDCQEYVASLNDNQNQLAPGAGARVYASRDNGATVPPALSSSVSPAPFNNPAPYPVSGSAVPVIAWEADPTIASCSIQVTFPPGVVSPNGIGTASNWGLPDHQVVVGSMTVPGVYKFAMNCDGELSSSVSFEIAGTPPVLLKAAGTREQLRRHRGAGGTNTAGPGSVSTNARPVDTVYVSWSADNVAAGSCTLMGPSSFSSTASSGLMQITVSGGVDQLYSFFCLGPNATYMVNLTIHPIAGTVCDVNEDGQIDINDIDAITAARGSFALGPQDSRDANGDGIIDVNDARVCVLRCTKPGCRL